MDVFTARDEQLASDVGRMAELGRFATEFVFYGCAYYENNEVLVLVGEKKEDLYEIVYKPENLLKLPTQVYTLRYSALVQGGTKEQIVTQKRQELAKEIASMYPKAYFEALQNLTVAMERNDEAYELLKELHYGLDGTGSEDDFKLFEGLLEFSYRRCLISERHYFELKQWLSWSYRDIANVPVRKDKYEHKFYAFAYLVGDTIKICLDGSKGNIYNKWEVITEQQEYVSPIITKKWWYNNDLDITEIRKACLQYLQTLFTPKYMQTMKLLHEMNVKLDRQAVELWRNQINAMESETILKESLRQERLLGVKV